MNRRMVLTAPLLLAACSVLPQHPYVERRQWPLDPRRPTVLPPRPDGAVLLVRTLRAGPGLESRGFRRLRSDGSVRTDPYEEWLVPPAEAVETALRDWLAASGLFAAVVAPGSRLPAGLVLEASLDALVAEPGRLRIALGLVLLSSRERITPLLQREVSADAPLPNDGAETLAHAANAVLASLLGRVEQVLGIRIRTA